MTSASSRVGLAVLVLAVIGGAAWMASGDDSGSAADIEPIVADTTAGPKVSFEPMTPQDQVKKRNMEAALRKIERAKQEGEVLNTGLIKVVDETGEPTYIHPRLVEGVGRNGEPLYALVQAKRTAPGPLVRDYKGIKTNRPVRKDVVRTSAGFDRGGEDGAKTGAGAGTGTGTGTGGANDG